MGFLTPQECSTPYTVSGINGTIAEMLAEDNCTVWVQAEVSSLKRHSSGHWYIRLKDQMSQIPAVVWKSYTSGISRDISEGDLVEIIAVVRVYPPRS